MKRFLPLLLTAHFLLTPTLAAAPGDIKSAPADSSVVATVGESEVLLSEVREALGKMDLRDQANASRDPATLNQVVRLLLVQRLMLQEARTAKWDEKAQVKAALERARETALAESFLQHVSEPAPDYPSNAELKQAYESLKPSLGTPKQWRLGQIYIAANPDATKEQLAAAEAKLETVKKALAGPDANFAKLAAAHSDDAVSAKQDGEIGWMAEAGIVQDIRTEATLLKVNEISKPIRLKDGWHILKCMGIRDAFVPELDDVAEPLRQRMRDERTKANSQAYVAKLLQDNPLSINEVAIKQALAKPTEKDSSTKK